MNSTEIKEAIESYAAKNCHSLPLTLRFLVNCKTVQGQNVCTVFAYDRGFEDAVFEFKFNQNTFKRHIKKHNDRYLCEAADKRAVYG